MNDEGVRVAGAATAFARSLSSVRGKIGQLDRRLLKYLSEVGMLAESEVEALQVDVEAVAARWPRERTRVEDCRL